VPLLVNSFEGGTAGASVSAANSGGASGNPFDSVSVTASGVSRFDSAHAAHGGLGNLIQCTTAAASNGQGVWSASMGTRTQVWYRLYLYWPALGSNTQRIWKATSAGALCSALSINSAGHVLATSAAGTTVLTSAATVPLARWFRVEGFVRCSATAGQLEFRLFTSGMDSGTPDEVRTSAATQVLTASADSYVYGLQSNSLVMSWWQDDVALSDLGYIGPAGAPPGILTARDAPGSALTAGDVPAGTLTAGAAGSQLAAATAAAGMLTAGTQPAGGPS